MLFFGSPINVSAYFPHVCFSHTLVVFLIIVCSLIERNKSFIIKFCSNVNDKIEKRGKEAEKVKWKAREEKLTEEMRMRRKITEAKVRFGVPLRERKNSAAI